MDYSQAFFLYTAALKLADALTVVGIWYACWYLRFHSALLPISKGMPTFAKYSHASLPLAVVFSAVFHVVGTYRRDRIHFGFRAFKKLVEGCILGTLVFIAICYFLYEFEYSRLYLALFPILAIAALVLERTALHFTWKWLERRGVRRTRILLMGDGELLRMYVDKLVERQPYPIDWVGRIGKEEDGEGLSRQVKYLGREDRLKSVLNETDLDMVVVSFPTHEMGQYESILELLSNELVSVKVLPDFGKYSTFTYSADHECGIPLLVFNQTGSGTTDRFLKRLFDIIGSAAFLALFSPVYLAIWILLKLTTKGPIIYRQLRVGADGRVFTLYKFCSMRPDAEATTGAVWATRDDDRTTPMGKWLRRTSLDEIPQFYNVLRGDMSLVGPRPERPVFVSQFKKEIPKYMLRHKMKSGITGWAQVNGWRGNTSLDERIKHDLYYIGHWSHRFDFKILCLTVVKGFVHSHAY